MFQQHDVDCSAGLWGLSTFQVAAGLSLAVTLPMLLIPTFQKLSWLNLMGFLSTGLVTATVMAAAVSDPSRSKQHQVPALSRNWSPDFALYGSSWQSSAVVCCWSNCGRSFGKQQYRLCVHGIGCWVCFFVSCKLPAPPLHAPSSVACTRHAYLCSATLSLSHWTLCLRAACLCLTLLCLYCSHQLGMTSLNGPSSKPLGSLPSACQATPASQCCATAWPSPRWVPPPGRHHVIKGACVIIGLPACRPASATTQKTL